MTYSLKDVERTILERVNSDAPISSIWGVAFFFNFFFIYFLLSLIGFAIMKTGVTELLLIVVILALILRLILIPLSIYNISKRLITHFNASRRVRAGLILYGREKFSDLTNCIALKSHYEVYFYEKKMSPTAYALLSIIPFASTLIIYSLSKSFYIHHIKETSLAMGIRASIDMGTDFIKEAFKLRRENLALYVLLSLITAEVFLVFWVFIIIRDFRNHLEFHEKFEKEFLSSIQRAETHIAEESVSGDLITTD